MTTEELTELAGRPVPAPSADDEAATDCDTTSEDLAVVVFWQSRPDAGPLDAEVEASASDGLERTAVTVAGQEGALLTGEDGGQRIARVVTVVDGQALLVGVAYFEVMGEADASAETLRDLALGVAERAAATLA